MHNWSICKETGKNQEKRQPMKSNHDTTLILDHTAKSLSPADSSNFSSRLISSAGHRMSWECMVLEVSLWFGQSLGKTWDSPSLALCFLIQKFDYAGLCPLFSIPERLYGSLKTFKLTFTSSLACLQTQFSSVQPLSRVRLLVTPWMAAHQASLSITNSWSLLKFMSVTLVMPSNHLILCHPLLLLPSIFPSIRVFSESILRIRWLKCWSLSFSISPSNEHPGLISFRMDWLDLLAVQGTLKSLQHHSSKASILWHSVFFVVQLSHPYMTIGKTIALTRWTFVGKVMSLLFNMLPRLVITFLPRSKCLLISWLQSPSAVILKPPPKNSLSLFPLFPHLFAMKWWDQMPWS